MVGGKIVNAVGTHVNILNQQVNQLGQKVVNVAGRRRGGLLKQSKTEKAMMNFLNDYKKTANIEIKSRLKILKQIMKGTVEDNLFNSDLVNDC